MIGGERGDEREYELERCSRERKGRRREKEERADVQVGFLRRTTPSTSTSSC